MPHAERPEHFLLHIGTERDSGRTLDDGGQQYVIAVGIRHRLAGLAFEMRVVQAFDCHLQVQLIRRPAAGQQEVVAAAQAAAVLEQVAQGDARPVGAGQSRQDFGGAGASFDPSLLFQPQDGQRSQSLAQRGQPHRGVHRQWLLGFDTLDAVGPY